MGRSEGEFWVSLTDPRLQRPGRHHNQLLVLGFRAYYRALLAPAESQDRSERILTGNCLLALHEQRLLSLAITVGFRSWLRTLTTPWAVLEARHHWRHRDPGRARIGLEDAWVGFATRRLIGAQLPTGLVKTGAAVPAGSDPIVVQRLPLPGEPQGRRPLDDLDEREILGKLFMRLDVDGEPARCWNDLRDRMAFMAALFAALQRAPFWFDAIPR